MESDAISYEAQTTNASTAVNAAAEVKTIGWLKSLIVAALGLLPMKKVKALSERVEAAPKNKAKKTSHIDAIIEAVSPQANVPVWPRSFSFAQVVEMGQMGILHSTIGRKVKVSLNPAKSDGIKQLVKWAGKGNIGPLESMPVLFELSRGSAIENNLYAINGYTKEQKLTRSLVKQVKQGARYVCEKVADGVGCYTPSGTESWLPLGSSPFMGCPTCGGDVVESSREVGGNMFSTLKTYALIGGEYRQPIKVQVQKKTGARVVLPYERKNGLVVPELDIDIPPTTGNRTVKSIAGKMVRYLGNATTPNGEPFSFLFWVFEAGFERGVVDATIADVQRVAPLVHALRIGLSPTLKDKSGKNYETARLTTSVLGRWSMFKI